MIVSISAKEVDGDVRVSFWPTPKGKFKVDPDKTIYVLFRVTYGSYKAIGVSDTDGVVNLVKQGKKFSQDKKVGRTYKVVATPFLWEETI